ncbi:MAG: EamA family transporter [Ruminococcus sp.]|jgi:transporter family protein|nr:EamA family transporter [Ruminococcus sp.]
MWLIFAFGSAVFAGITAILAKIGIKNIDSDAATAVRTIIVLVFSWIMVFVTSSYSPLSSISSKTLLFLVLSGAATGASWLCYFKALQKGNVNKVTPIDKSSTVLTLLLAAIILKEKISAFGAFGIAAIAIGTYLMIVRKSDTPAKPEQKGWLFYAVLSAIFASLTAILGKIGISNIDSNLGTAIRTAVVLVMAWTVVFAEKKLHKVKDIDKKSFIFICLSGITTGLSWLCYYKALHDGNASIVVPVDKLSIIITIAFSYFALKEKISAKSLIGLLMISSGTIMLIL